MLSHLHPHYAIIFEGGDDILLPTNPFVTAPVNQDGCTLPHGFDLKVSKILDLIWYCLHLPRSMVDFVRLGASNAYQHRDFGQPHHIDLLPLEFLLTNNFLQPMNGQFPDIILCLDSNFAIVSEMVSDNHLHSEITKASALNDKMLEIHWNLIFQLLKDRADNHRNIVLEDRIPYLLQPNDDIEITLPITYFTRKLTDRKVVLDFILKSRIEKMNRAFRWHSYKSALVIAENSATSRSIDCVTKDEFEDILDSSRGTFQTHVSVGVPGFGGQFRKLTRPNESIDNMEIESQVLRLMVTHSAVGKDGIGIMLNEPSDSLYSLVAQLEQHYHESAYPQPKVVHRLLEKIGTEMCNLFDETSITLLEHASTITCHSYLPIGLTRLPNCTAPLCCVKPVWYRSILPMTRALQTELSGEDSVYFGNTVKVLIAECISASDPVGRVSRSGMRSIVSLLKTSPNIQVDYIEPINAVMLKEELNRVHYDILVLSAHGMYRNKNIAGLMCGKDFLIDLEDCGVPPLVILSACSPIPRGNGAINIGDLLLRNGAKVVVGSMVPVNVKRNSLLLARLFSYIVDSLNGDTRFRTFAELWHFVSGSNALHDILSGNSQMDHWANTGRDAISSVQGEFKMKASIGRLRGGHLYEDSINILRDIATQRKMSSKFKAWINTGYLPETLFYLVLGFPDKLFLKDSKMDEYMRNHCDGTIGKLL